VPFKDAEAAREAGRRSAQVRRERREQQRLLNEQAARQGTSADTLIPGGGAAPGGSGARGAGSSATDQADIAVVRELERKAQSGDVAAARELREWRRRDPAQDADADALAIAAIVVRFTRSQRAELRSMLLQILEGPANEGIREGTIDGFDAPPPTGTGPTASPADDEPIPARGTGGVVTALQTPPNDADTPPERDEHEPLPADESRQD
jgi:hypothetical protein